MCVRTSNQCRHEYMYVYMYFSCMMWVTMATGDYGNTVACLTTPDATETHQSDKCREMSLIGGSCMHLCVAGAVRSVLIREGSDV